MAEEKTLDSIIKSLHKKYNEDVISVGVNDLRSYGTLSLGSPSLDFCLYNSLPEKRIIEYSGAEGSGKTSLCYITAASFQKKELERNPENPRKILYVDLEACVDPNWAKLMGYDMNTHPVQTIRFLPEDMPAEKIFDVVLDCVRTGEVGLIIIDSLNMLVPMQVYDESLEKKEMGGIAKVLGDFVRRITSLLVKYSCTLIGINQLRENIGGYGNPITTSGGRAWKHGCSVRLMLKKSEFFDENGDKVTSSAESPAGYVMEVAVLKTKVCKWDRKLGRSNINYTTGIDIIQDTIDVATYFGLIDNSTQGTFKILNPETLEPMLDANGNEVKIRGKKNVKPYFKENLDIWKKLYDAVYEKLSKKDEPNIVAFEKMLNMNVEDYFGVNFDAEESAS